MRTSSETRRSLPPSDVSDDDKRRRAPEIERLFEVHLGELLDRATFKINEGKNGVIFKVPILEVPTALRETLLKDGIDLETDRVFKVLKVYAPGVAQREFEMQQRAYLAVEQARARGEQVARIPKPFFVRDIHLGKATQEKFKHSGIKVEGGKAGVIMMDFAEGEDLATLLYKEVLRRHGYDGSLLLEMPLDEIMEQVAGQLKFNRPGGKGRDEAEREFEKRKIELENADKLFQFLANAGFKINAAIPDTVERTIQTLHASGLLWLDGHERNMMIHGSLSGSDTPTLHIIDFGGSRTFEGKLTADQYTHGTPRGVHHSRDDFDIVRVLRLFTEKREGAASGDLSLVERARVRLEKDKIFRARVEQARLLPPARALEQGFSFYSVGDAVKIFPLFVFALLEGGRVSKEVAQQFAISKLENLESFQRSCEQPLRDLLEAIKHR